MDKELYKVEPSDAEMFCVDRDTMVRYLDMLNADITTYTSELDTAQYTVVPLCHGEYVIITVM